MADPARGRLHALKHFNDQAKVFAQQAVVQCFLHQSCTFEPLRSAPMQAANIALAVVQALAEELDKQGMQPIPLLARLVHRLDEQITRLDRGDQRGGVGQAGDMGGELGIETPQ
ncbi:hypothetical protein D9M71_690330 [compost metagenome]